MKEFYANYAVYDGTTYREISYLDKVELFALDDTECKNILFSVQPENIEDKFTVLNKAILYGLEYVYYDIKDGLVTYSATYKDKKILQRNINDFDLIFQAIISGQNKPMETKMIYSKDNDVADVGLVKSFYPQEMTNGNIMFNVSSALISRDDMHKAIQDLYAGRVSETPAASDMMLMDEIIEWIIIDGIKFCVLEDLCWEMVTIYPEQKEAGEKYIFEIVNYFNKDK